MPSDAAQIAIIGNSHVGTIWQGLDVLRSTGQPIDFDVQVFALPDRCQTTLEVQQGVLQARAEEESAYVRTTGRGRKLDLTPCKAIILVGMANVFSTHQLKRFVASYSAESHRYEASNRLILSDACFELAMSGLIEPDPFPLLCRKIREVTDVPIAVLPAPQLAVGRPDERGRHANADLAQWEAMAAAVEATDAAAMRRSWKSAVARVLGSDYTFLDQPEETLATPVVSHLKYLGPDASHMNGEYGAICLRECFAWARSVIA